MQTPSTANATRERHPTRSAPDTVSRRASHTLSHRECARVPPALPQRLKTSYSEPREARSHDTRDRARGAGQSATSNDKAARTTRITVTRHQRNSSRTRRKQKAPRQARNARTQRGHNNTRDVCAREREQTAPPALSPVALAAPTCQLPDCDDDEEVCMSMSGRIVSGWNVTL